MNHALKRTTDDLTAADFDHLVCEACGAVVWVEDLRRIAWGARSFTELPGCPGPRPLLSPSPAARLALVQGLMGGKDPETGEERPALISNEEALSLLDAAAILAAEGGVPDTIWMREGAEVKFLPLPPGKIECIGIDWANPTVSFEKMLDERMDQLAAMYGQLDPNPGGGKFPAVLDEQRVLALPTAPPKEPCICFGARSLRCKASHGEGT